LRVYPEANKDDTDNPNYVKDPGFEPPLSPLKLLARAPRIDLNPCILRVFPNPSHR
jgi:hypothetical protein